MKIVDVICSKGRTGFFFDDQRAIIKNAVTDGGTYKGKAVTEGFTAIRQAGEAISVMLILEDGQVAYGDCAAVQYSGAGGRDPLFLAEDFIPVINKYITPLLIGEEVDSFRKLADKVEKFINPVTGRKVHTAIRYGVTQAVLDAVAKNKKLLMAEVVAKEYNTQLADRKIPIFCQSGDDRYNNVDKMIIKRAEVLPHGLINNVDTKLGKSGELLIEYVKWLRRRIDNLRTDKNYIPVLHLDVYGTIAMVFNNDYGRMITYFKELEKAAYPLKIRIEGPIDVEEREGQMLALKELTRLIDEEGMNVQIVADEWCNTLEDIKYFADNRAGHMIQIKTPDLGGIQNIIDAILYCKQMGVGAYQGGTCNETERSSQVCVHIAMAAKPDQILAKPGMGVDEGFMIVYNEMERILALRNRKGA